VSGGADEPLETSTDRFFGGRLSLEQPRRGLRAGTDSLLLALEASGRTAERVVDLGAGVGAVGLAVALALPAAQVTLFELAPALCTLATRNAAANGLLDRVTVRRGDVRTARRLLPAASADLVVTNPPYYPVGTGRLSPDPLRAAAHHEVAGTLTDFLGAARHVLRPGGELIVVYKPERLADLLQGLRAADLPPTCLRPVYPSREDTDAVAVLVSARAGGGPTFCLAPPRYADELGATSGPVARRAPA
jgi:tRNA1Val (adenine37-N6)-methyltransferase